MVSHLLLSAWLAAAPAAEASAIGPPAAPTAGSASAGDQGLAAWRSARRDAVRRRSLAAVAPDKTLAEPAASPARFGLLVIPVDFSDARLPAGWNPAGLGPRLSHDAGQSLRRYFAVASAGRCELAPVLAPLVRLPGRASDYSDLGWNGFSRSRRLAREALQAIAAAGFDLGLADLDGPDGLPRSGDDDGRVDGVLVLHAETGQENDAQDGLIQALQYYLDEPVVAGGVAADAYAVASLWSGPGIWAHETAHLLGLEDRYDPLLDPVSGAGDLAGAGGLGIYSLMAAGALGTGGGWGPSLPDAYSRALLGWCDVRTVTDSPAAGDTLRVPGVAGDGAHRVWTRDGSGSEFLLLEARDPAAVTPFDAALPAAGLAILHIDESVPEGGWAEDGPGRWHLRARLVEADGGGELQAGLDTGTAADLFGIAGGASTLSPSTTPSSDGYAAPSGVSITGIDGGAGFSVHRSSSAASTWFVMTTAWTGAGPVHPLEFAAVPHAGTPAALSLRVETLGPPAWGTLEGGSSVEVALARGDDGSWRPAAAVSFTRDPGLPAGAVTRFRYTLAGPGLVTQRQERDWAWDGSASALDFAGAWPGSWAVTQPDGAGTAWTRWTGAGSPLADGLPVLACTGETVDPSAWPSVSYTNGGRARLTSAPLGDDVAGVRLLHWVDVEALPGGVPMDGAGVAWVGPDGVEVPAEPAGGWPARVDGSSGSALRGRGSFGREPGELDGDGRPVWRCDDFAAPTGGPGPWRLRLELAANDLWRARGWLVAGVAALATVPTAPPGGLGWDGRELAWSWDWAPVAGSPRFTVQARALPDSSWVSLLETDANTVPAEDLVPLLPGAPGDRRELRVTGPTAWGTLALAPVAVYVGEDTQAPGLGTPWPNPAAGEVRFAISTPVGDQARLVVYDLRGRRVHTRDIAAGVSFVAWDGRDDEGRRLPAGTYLLRLEGAAPAAARKVVLTH